LVKLFWRWAFLPGTIGSYLSQKYTIQNMAGRVPPVVECLSGKHEAKFKLQK
jgi:hypothetical protein